MLTDPVADMLTRIRNAGMVHKAQVAMPSSRLRQGIAEILANEGYVGQVSVEGAGHAARLQIELRYAAGRVPVIRGLRRVSKPGGRVYRGTEDLPRVQGGLGVAIISTSQGLMADRDARRQRLGGEVICEVW